MTKKWYMSKTVWLNAAVGALAIIDQVMGSGVLAQYPQLLAVVAGLNVWLRTATKTAVKV